MHKDRSSTPCIGICSTTFGDDVCKGCKRFSHEITNWGKFSNDERAVVNSRLDLNNLRLRFFKKSLPYMIATSLRVK